MQVAALYGGPPQAYGFSMPFAPGHGYQGPSPAAAGHTELVLTQHFLRVAREDNLLAQLRLYRYQSTLIKLQFEHL